LDKGHTLLEMDFATVDFSQDGRSRSRNLSVADFNLKFGLTNNSDLQIGFNPWVQVLSEDLASGATQTQGGQGDLVIRLKVNLWGDDGGKTNFGLMPFVKIPTAASGIGNGATEGGLILPLGLTLGAGFDLGTMIELDANKNGSDGGTHGEGVFSASLGHALIGNLSFYLEYWGLVTAEPGANGQQSIDAGLTYGVGPDTLFDLGINVALLDAGNQDLNPFIGVSRRF